MATAVTVITKMLLPHVHIKRSYSTVKKVKLYWIYRTICIQIRKKSLL